MKKMFILSIAAALLCGASLRAEAIDFSIHGMWQTGFGAGETSLVSKRGQRQKNADDSFKARSRIRLQMDAVASEALSGSLWLEIGHQQWGTAAHGASLGADGQQVKVRAAYLDWAVPDTPVRMRMGLVNMNLPNAAGGSQVMSDANTATVTTSVQLNEYAGLTAFWARPFNDNFTGKGNGRSANLHDNMDLFGLTIPLKFDGLEVTPWAMYGIRGANTFERYSEQGGVWSRDTKYTPIWVDVNPAFSLSSHPMGGYLAGDTDKAYGSMFWAGLPVRITALDPWNIEFDFNYGYVESLGRYDVSVRDGQRWERAQTRRAGWVAKALVEYKLDWGVPGIFGWYASGDDGSLKNGSERMPSLSPYGNFTSFFGDQTLYGGGFVDMAVSYTGTWGLGLQLRDVSFLDNLSHTFRAVYWGGTNSTSMVKYFGGERDGWANGVGNYQGPYLTTRDGMVEFNLNTYYDIYENLRIGLETGYIINMMDHATWQDGGKSYLGASYAKQDAWKANLLFRYSF